MGLALFRFFCATPRLMARTLVRRMMPGMSSRRARRDMALVLFSAVRARALSLSWISPRCAVEVSSLIIGNDSGVITRLLSIGSGRGMRIESRAGARPVCTTINTSLSPGLALFLSRSSRACSSSGVFGRSSAALR